MSTLVAGANAALTAENPGLTAVVVGLGWDVVANRGPAAELVPFVVLCDASGRALPGEHPVFFNQIESAGGAVRYLGDDDHEEIDVDLAAVPAAVDHIVFVVYVDPDPRGRGDFSAVRSAFIRVARPDGSELVRFPLPSWPDRSIDAALFGELYRHRDQWKFRALGQGYTTGLEGVFRDYGITP